MSKYVTKYWIVRRRSNYCRNVPIQSIGNADFCKEHLLQFLREVEEESPVLKGRLVQEL
jgi:hypothetical protein